MGAKFEVRQLVGLVSVCVLARELELMGFCEGADLMESKLLCRWVVSKPEIDEFLIVAEDPYSLTVELV